MNVSKPDRRRAAGIVLFTAVLLGFVLTSTPVSGQTGPSLGASITPEALVPMGVNAANYGPGLGVRADGLIGLPRAGALSPGVETAVAFVPLNLGQRGFAADTNLALLRGGLSLQAGLPLGERFSVTARAHAGGYFAALQGAHAGSDTGLTLGGGVGLGCLLTPRVLLELGTGYDSYLGLYDGMTVSVRATARVAGRGTALIPRADFSPIDRRDTPVEGYIQFAAVNLDRVFPVLYKYYDTHPIGQVVVRNQGTRATDDIEVRFALNRFMDAPKVSARIEALAPGEERTVDLYALFTDEILGVTEGAKVAAEIRVTYAVDDRPGADTEVVTLDTFERNALRWDDDRKIAAFVTARDDEIQRFARNVASIVDDGSIEAVPRELRLAVAVLAAMDEHRCAYVVDPTSPYAELSQDTIAVDSVQFPRQTLQFRAGDCDDLSATYAALMEAVGVETAFITVPGHIYTAVRLAMDGGAAERAFSRPGDVIRVGDEAWVPVETTLLGDGFLAAWGEGARQWREHSRSGAAALLPIHEAWRTYEPVAFPVADYEIVPPPREELVASFTAELDRFVSREIAELEQTLVARLRRAPENARLLNRLGTLYARYGRFEEARVQFQAASRDQAYVPALVNMGNIAYLEGDLDEARRSWERVLAVEADNATALLGIARLEFAAERYAAAEEAHARLVQLDPALAERFSHLGTGETAAGRASEASQLQSVVVWEE